MNHNQRFQTYSFQNHSFSVLQQRYYSSWGSIKSAKEYTDKLTKGYKFDIVYLGEYKNRGIVANQPIKKDEVVLCETPYLAVCNKCVQGYMSCGYCQARQYYEPMVKDKLLVHPKHAAQEPEPEQQLEPFLNGDVEETQERRKNVELYCERTGERFPLMAKKLVAKIMQSFLETGSGDIGMAHVQSLCAPKLPELPHEWKVHYHLLCKDLFQGEMEDNKEYFNEEWYQKVIGILHLNTFELDVEKAFGSKHKKTQISNQNRTQNQNGSSNQSKPSYDDVSVITLYILGSYINHSCVPNIGLRITSKEYKYPLATEFVALRDIEAGEELSLSYVDLEQSLEEREKQLQFGYGFTCYDDRCSDCQIKESASS